VPSQAGLWRILIVHDSLRGRSMRGDLPDNSLFDMEIWENVIKSEQLISDAESLHFGIDF
jgi:hypothetical protein